MTSPLPQMPEPARYSRSPSPSLSQHQYQPVWKSSAVKEQPTITDARETLPSPGGYSNPNYAPHSSSDMAHDVEKHSTALSLSDLESSRRSAHSERHELSGAALRRDILALVGLIINTELDFAANIAQVYLALPAIFVSLGITIYTFLAVLYAVLISPLRLCCCGRQTLSAHALSLLRPPLRLQYQCVFRRAHRQPTHSLHSHLPPPASFRSSPPGQSPAQTARIHTEPRLRTMVLTHVLSPFIAGAAAFAAWVFAFFWVLSALTADELADGGRKRGCDDGRGLARGLVTWWVWWLDGDIFEGEGTIRLGDLSENRSER